MQKGDIGSIFTPDDIHFEIAKAAIKKGIHLMITKPICKTLKEHKELI
jgi:D-galacturonate reductase